MDETVRMKQTLPLLATALALTAAMAAALPQPIAAASPQPDGATVFRQRCQSCHTLTPGKAAIGPSLAGVVGRKAASTDFKYSPALQHSGLTWKRDTLDRYLTAPNKLVPGTRMTVSLSDKAQRTALITYLEKAK
jgi:cytochrome c